MVVYSLWTVWKLHLLADHIFFVYFVSETRFICIHIKFISVWKKKRSLYNISFQFNLRNQLLSVRIDEKRIIWKNVAYGDCSTNPIYLHIYFVFLEMHWYLFLLLLNEFLTILIYFMKLSFWFCLNIGYFVFRSLECICFSVMWLG